MSTHHETYEDYKLTDEEAGAILAESPDKTLIADYVGGFLTDDEMVAFRERLRTDAAFRELANPRLDAWYRLPKAQQTMTLEELTASWEAFNAKSGVAPKVASGQVDVHDAMKVFERFQRESLRGLRAMQVAAATLFLVGLPLMGVVGYLIYPAIRTAGTHMSVGELPAKRLSFGATSFMTLEPGARVYWNDRPNANGEFEAYLVEGAARFDLRLDLNGSFVVRTPAGRIQARWGTFTATVESPVETRVQVEQFDARLRAASDSTNTELEVSAGQRARMQWGQPPRRDP